MPVCENALQALLDKHAIYDVLARYARAIDRRDAALLRSVFHPDAIDHHVGYRASAAEFCSRALQVLEGIGPTAHYMGFPLVELDGETAYCECYAIAFHRVGEGDAAFDDFLGARVLDRFEKREGEWRIAYRRVVYDWNRDVAVAEHWGKGAFGTGACREGRSGPDDPLYDFLKGANVTNRVLMVVSSRARLGETDQPTGTWLEELAASYYVFLDAGFEVDLASPLGGAAPIDPLSLDDPWVTADGKRFIADPAAQAKLAGTLSLAAVKPEQFRAIYLVGGAATAWDFPDNADLTSIVEALHRAGRPVAGVCHGVLGLTRARDSNGVALVHGRSVTGISNAEEIMTGFDKVVPVLPENRLRDLGGRYSCAPPLEMHVMVDSGVMTGQNPASAGPLARAVLKELIRQLANVPSEVRR